MPSTPTQTIQERLFSLLSRELDLPRAEIGPDLSLVSDLNLDSLEMIELAGTIEEEFQVEIEDEELEKAQTLQQLAELIREKRGEGV